MAAPERHSPDHVPVYLVHYRAPDWCAASVESILDSVDVRPTVSVIDNGGLEVSLSDSVRVLRQRRNLGYAGGANVALADWRRSDAEFCVIGSHDVRVEPGTLAALVRGARSTPEFGVLGPFGIQTAHDESSPTHASVAERPWISGSFMLLRRACVEATGPFDERFGSYVEDVDYCLRARERGWLVGAVPAAHATQSGSSSPRAAALNSANLLLLRTLHSAGHERVRGRVLLLLLGVKAGVAALLRRQPPQMAGRPADFAYARLRAFAASLRRPTTWRRV